MSTTQSNSAPYRTVGAQNLEGGDAIAWQQLNANADQRRQIRANATSLEEDEWEQMDEAVMQEALRPLNLVNAIEGAGLTHDVSMSVTESTWQVRSGEFTEAERTMDARSRSEEDAPAYGKDGVPIPIIHKDYRIGHRELAVSRSQNTALDTAMAEDAGRVVGELLERQVLEGWDATFNSNFQMYGLLNHPDRNTYTGGDWSDGPTAKSDVQNMVYALEDDNFYANSTGYWLVLADQQARHLNEDYKPSVDVDRSTREKVMEVDGVENIVRTPYMPAGEAVMFKPVSKVFDLARDPSGVQNIQWESHGGMETHNKVMALQAPRVKSTYAGRCGIVHTTGMS